MSDSDQQTLTYDLNLLESSETKWRRSSALRIIYASLFEAIRSRLQQGDSLELGSGIGNLKEFIPSVVTSDLVKTKYVDKACSAYDIPCFSYSPIEKRWANIIAVDMLHHLCRPMDFFDSAANALESGGRIILVEPAATFYGTIFYKLFHNEPIDLRPLRPPFEFMPDSEDGQFANMGMGVALFNRHRQITCSKLSELSLEVVEVSYRDFLAYPLSGGYSGPQLAPKWVIEPLLKLESLFSGIVYRFIGLRMIIVLQKT